MNLDKYSIIILQVGSNDLSNIAPSRFRRELMSFARFLQEKHCIQKIVLMEILHRVHTRKYRMKHTVRQYNQAVDAANGLLTTACRARAYMSFWQHRRLHLRRLVARDGVHLNEAAMPRYWRSVKGAILGAMRT